MRFIAILSLFLAAIVGASSGAAVKRDTSDSDLPACVIPCIADSVDGTGCASTDATCLCASAAYITLAALCLQKKCDSIEEQSIGLRFGQSYCLSVGVSVTAPVAELSSLQLTTGYGGIFTPIANATTNATATITSASGTVATASATATSGAGRTIFSPTSFIFVIFASIVLEVF